ncbi:MAG: 3-hydroxyacyl-thioester dehydratase HtdZ [Mycobacteriales bacterium]
MHVFANVAELAAHDADLGRSAWLALDHERVGRYAQAVGSGSRDGLARAGAVQQPQSATVNRYLALALIPVLSQQIWRIQVQVAVNAGLNKIRFGPPILTGARIQLRSALVSVRPLAAGALVVINEQIFSASDPEPVLIAETLTLLRS